MPEEQSIRDLSPELNEALRDKGVEIVGRVPDIFEDVMTPEALGFIADLTRKFREDLRELLQRRRKVLNEIRRGVLPGFPPETKEIRESSWRVAPIPRDLEVRYVEITGPSGDRKMFINALNSGADIYMTDFEDSLSPTWRNILNGQLNIMDAVRRRIEFKDPVSGKHYKLGERVASLCVRPRGLHLIEKHLIVDGSPVPAPIFDVGMYAFVNSLEQVRMGITPHLYLPKLESYLEARWWSRFLAEVERRLGLSHGSFRVSVLIEHILAAFQMEEILYELRDYITALNLGRWDYIYSFIKTLGHNRKFLLPDRNQVTMTTHFLKSAALLLVQTCHKRGAYAIGGMAAQVPRRGDPKAEAAIEKVKSDKLREISEGFDGAWVAHPALVPVIRSLFEENMPGKNQLQVTHEGLVVSADDLLKVPEGRITEEGLRNNVHVALRYLEAWLRGVGSVAISYPPGEISLMEDTATFEICRTQLWQWIIHEASLPDGRTINEVLFRDVMKEELERIKSLVGKESYESGRFELASRILDEMTTTRELIEFMPSYAYQYLE